MRNLWLAIAIVVASTWSCKGPLEQFEGLPPFDSDEWESAIAELPLDRLIYYRNRTVDHQDRDTLFNFEIGRRGKPALLALIDAMAVRDEFSEFRPVAELLSAASISKRETGYEICQDNQLRHRIDRLIRVENGHDTAQIAGLTGYIDRYCERQNLPLPPSRY